MHVHQYTCFRPINGSYYGHRLPFHMRTTYYSFRCHMIVRNRNIRVMCQKVDQTRCHGWNGFHRTIREEHIQSKTDPSKIGGFNVLSGLCVRFIAVLTAVVNHFTERVNQHELEFIGFLHDLCAKLISYWISVSNALILRGHPYQFSLL